MEIHVSWNTLVFSILFSLIAERFLFQSITLISWPLVSQKRGGSCWSLEKAMAPHSRKWQHTPVFLPGESQGRGAWWAAIYGVTQSRTWLKRLSSSSRDIDYAVENNNIKYASYAFTPVVSGLKKKKSVYFPPSWVLVAGWPGCGEQGLLFSALLGLLSAVASLLQSSGSGARGLPQVRLPGSRLVALQLVESSQTTGQTHVSCISKPVLSLWATS